MLGIVLSFESGSVKSALRIPDDRAQFWRMEVTVSIMEAAGSIDDT